jgi:hypothetical protein
LPAQYIYTLRFLTLTKKKAWCGNLMILEAKSSGLPTNFQKTSRWIHNEQWRLDDEVFQSHEGIYTTPSNCWKAKLSRIWRYIPVVVPSAKRKLLLTSYVIYCPYITLMYIHFTTSYLQSVFLLIIFNSYMLRLHILVIFRQLQVRWACTVYMAICQKWPADYIYNFKIITPDLHRRGPGSSDGIKTDYRLGGPGIEFQWGARFFARPDRSWDPPSPLYSVYRVFPGGKERPWRAADHSPPYSAEVLKE